LDSIYAQSFTDFEVILLDNASTDESVDIFEEYARRPNTRLVVNEKNNGSPFKQWNKGVAMARGEYVWIAESDDFADANLLSNTMGKFEEFPACGLVYCRSRIVDENNEEVPDWTPVVSSPQATRGWHKHGLSFIRRQLCVTNYIMNASAVVFKKELYRLAGCAPDDFVYAGDWLTWCRIVAQTEVCYLPNELNCRRVHNDTMTKGRVYAADRARERYVVREMIFREFGVSLFRRVQSRCVAFEALCTDVNVAWGSPDDVRLGREIGASDPLTVIYIFAERLKARCVYILNALLGRI